MAIAIKIDPKRVAAMDLEEALSELEREQEVRMRCFERWAKEGRISAYDANDRLNRLAKAIQAMTKLAGLAEPVNEGATQPDAGNEKPF